MWCDSPSGPCCFKNSADIVDLFRVDWSAVEIPNACLYAHCDP